MKKILISIVLALGSSCISINDDVYASENAINLSKEVINSNFSTNSEMLISTYERGCNDKDHHYIDDVYISGKDLIDDKGMPHLNIPIISEYIIFEPRKSNSQLSDTIRKLSIEFSYDKNKSSGFTFYFLEKNGGWCFNDISVFYMPDSVNTRLLELSKNPPVIPASALKK